MAGKNRRSPPPSPSPLPKMVFAQASPHSLGGRSLFEADGRLGVRVEGAQMHHYPAEDRIETALETGRGKGVHEPSLSGAREERESQPDQH